MNIKTIFFMLILFCNLYSNDVLNSNDKNAYFKDLENSCKDYNSCIKLVDVLKKESDEDKKHFYYFLKDKCYEDFSFCKAYVYYELNIDGLMCKKYPKACMQEIRIKTNDVKVFQKVDIDECLNSLDDEVLKSCANNYADYANLDATKVLELKNKLCTNYPKVCYDYAFFNKQIGASAKKDNLIKSCDLGYALACDRLVKDYSDISSKYFYKSCFNGNKSSCIEYELQNLKNEYIKNLDDKCFSDSLDVCEKAFDFGSENANTLTLLCDNSNAKACLKYASLNTKNSDIYEEYNLKACKIDVNICVENAKLLEQFLPLDFEGNINTVKNYYKIACDSGYDLACEEFNRVNSLNPDDYKFDGKLKIIKIKF